MNGDAFLAFPIDQVVLVLAFLTQRGVFVLQTEGDGPDTAGLGIFQVKTIIAFHTTYRGVIRGGWQMLLAVGHSIKALDLIATRHSIVVTLLAIVTLQIYVHTPAYVQGDLSFDALPPVHEVI